LYGDASDDPSKSIASNRVTFTNETKDGATTLGSISVSATGDSVVAANIKFDDDVLAADNATDLKKKSLLTIDFQNEPTVEVAVNELGDDLKPTGETKAVGLAHVYAHAKNGDAVALQLADGVNLRFTGDSALFSELSAEDLENQKRVGIFAYSESENQEQKAVGIVLDGKAEGEAVGTPNFEEDTGYDQTLTFLVPTKIYAKSEVKNNGSAYSAAAAIGKARANVPDNDNILLNGSIKYDIGNNNEFLATSSSSSHSSSAAIIGISVGYIQYGGFSMSGDSRYEIGNNNTLSATSSSSYSSAGVVLGASVGYASNTVRVSGDSRYKIGNNNTFSVTSSSDSCSSGVVIGASAGLSDSSVGVSGDSRYEIGNDNILSATSSSSENSSGVVIGASFAGGYGGAYVSGNNIYR
ncbi:MAG: hypothetical protein K2L13_02365, partial [Opitutales bacterium]|nr:hypothetical protein [Opitutales bacterium]